jgi:3-hydroxyacyl-[acyl-carrier-protein] dehydratase
MNAGVENRFQMNIDQIRKFLPHRAPFLLVDRILEIHPSGEIGNTSWDSSKVGTRVVALKNVTYNEPVFQGHFPDYSIFPGVLILEIMAQASSFSVYPYMIHQMDRIVRGDFQCILVGVDHARFRRPVIPGDSLKVETIVTKCRGRLWAFRCDVTADGQRVAEAEIMANLLMTGESV